MQGVVKISDSRYPELLRKIDAPPQKLYYKGTWDRDIFKSCLAVVGSRRMTTYGRQITRKLVSEAVLAGLTVVSGFMYGIDAAAHKAALDFGGRTIAVMPCGIELIHPEHQKDLHDKILQNKGLIISEYKGCFSPALWTYPKRNRIVAGISQATLVVEAAEKSGSLITADFAQKYRRKVFAVPGPLTSSVSIGTIRLIKEGAGIVSGAADLLVAYDIERGELFKKTSSSVGPGGIEEKIINKLQQEPLEIDKLVRLLGISASKVGTVLSLMQVKGVVFEENGKYYLKQSC
jgi:DNA processing protein